MNVEPEVVTSSAAATQKVAGTSVCCPRFDPEPWRDQTFSWKDKPFIKRRVHSFAHIPLNVAHVFATERARIAAAHAESPDRIVLSDENSVWGADYYFAVSKPLSGVNMESLSGTFLTHVFEGPFRNMSRWVEEMNTLAAARGADVEKLYFWYTTCPRCAKAYGENYVVLFAKIGA